MPPQKNLQMNLRAITVDCADPLALAAFYQEATGLELHPRSDDSFAGLSGADGLLFGFQRVDDYQPPRWPDQRVPQQFHLDFAVQDVEDLAEAEARLLALGAGKPDHQPGDKPELQPGEKRWLVLTDPAGHPFCLVGRR